MRVPRLIANGIELEVESFGRKADPAVLLIMGMGMQLLAWPDALRQLLAKSGYTAPYTLETMAEDAIGVLDALGIERAHLIGVSCAEEDAAGR